MLALVALLAGANAARAALPVLGHKGRWLTDPQGRVVILHGVQVDKFKDISNPAGSENVVDLSPANVRFIGSAGFNAARVSMSYEGVEPAAGRYDDSYIASYLTLDRELASAGIWDVLDLQQGQYSNVLSGNGFPDWMTDTGGVPNNHEPYSRGYLDNPAEQAAWDNLWGNAPVAGGSALEDDYVRGLRLLAGRFASAPALLGLEIVNEPWPGSRWPTCANPVGCPPGGFDQTSLTDFYRRVVPALRSADPRHLIVYEPNLLFDFGAPTTLGSIGDPNLLFAFHNYCLGRAPGLTAFPDPVQACGTNEGVVFDNAEARAASSGDALLMDEWGNSTDPVLNQRVASEADQHMVGWTVWAYEDCCNSPAAIVKDGTKPPTAPGNLNLPVLETLVRPYPQAIAGTPRAWSYDPDTRIFRLTYSTARAGDGTFAPGVKTQIEVPALHYPTGYQVTVDGARITSAPDGDPLLVESMPGAAVVTVTVSPADHHPPSPRTVAGGPVAGAPPSDCPASPARSLTVHTHGRRGRVVSVAVYIDRRRVGLRRGHNVRRIGLPPGLPNGALIRIVATTAHRARVITTRRVQGCALTKPRTRVRRAHRRR